MSFQGSRNSPDLRDLSFVAAASTDVDISFAWRGQGSWGRSSSRRGYEVVAVVAMMVVVMEAEEGNR
eukprot:12409358-Alexandrium_andersonii.AAC.1